MKYNAMNYIGTLILGLTFIPLLSGEDMQIGHIYSYETRPEERDSRFIILKIDDVKGVSVCSVKILGVKVKSPKSKDGVATFIGHLPISKEALVGSGIKDTGELSEVQWPNEGYSMWIEALKNGKAGYWKLSLRECITRMEEVLANQ